MFHFAPLSPTIREQRKQTMSPNLTIRLKLFISHALAVLLVSGSIGAFFYASALNSMQTGLKERLQSSAALISQTLDANTLRDVRCARDITCPGYINALGHLRTLQRMNSDIAFLYIMRQQGGRVFFVVDADETDKQAPPGKEYEKVPPTMMQGFTGLSVDQGITTDEWGGFITMTNTQGASVENPPSNSGTKMTRDEIMAIKDTSARQQAIAENIDQFR